MAEDPICDVPLDLVRLTVPLTNLAKHIAINLPIMIVAIGSSSTEGDGTADPAVSSYPARLEAILKSQLPAHAITVSNKGAGGEEADTELLRFDGDVIAQNPTLVIWQVGTNAVWKSYDLNKVGDAIVAGLQKLATCRTDIILMDLQYAPAVTNPEKLDSAKEMNRLIAEAARAHDANVFHRFDLMRHWNIDDNIPIEQMISNFDGHMLHQNAWSYNCVAQALAAAILDPTVQEA